MEKIVNIFDIANISSFEKYGIDYYLIADQKFSSAFKGLTKLQIKKYSQVIHQNHKKVMVKVDCLYQEDELDEFIKYLTFLNEIGIDALLFSDISVSQIVKDKHFNFKLVYGPDSLLTNQYDVKEVKQDGFDACIISKNIPLENMYKIVEEVKDFCYITIHGPVLMSYSKRHFISSYLRKKGEYLDNYYLSEENRDLKMPIVEKKNGSFFYYGCLESFDEYSEITKKPFKGIIIDNHLYDDDYTLKILEKYQNGLSDDSKDYIDISTIVETQLEK